MGSLNKDWLVEGLIDFEYKKYQLLAYFKQIKQEFRNTHLYPSLSELIFHYRNLKSVKENKDLFKDKFPKTLSDADFEKLKLSYKSVVEDNEIIQEMEEIIGYAIPKFQVMIEEGTEIYEFVERQMEFEPIGIMPIYNDEGYLLLNRDKSRDLTIYRYQTSVFESADERYKGLQMQYITNDFVDFSRSFEQVKIDLTKTDSSLPNPAAYLITYKMSFPEEPTVLPVAKRMLMRHLSAA